MNEQNRRAFELFIGDDPQTTAGKYFFLVPDDGWNEAFTMAGYCAVTVDDGFTAKDVTDVLTERAFDPKCNARKRVFVPCLPKKNNRLILTYFHDNGYSVTDDGWKLLKEEYLKNSNRSEELEGRINKYIEDHEGPSEDEEYKLTCLEDIEEKQVEWFSTNRIPRSEINIFAGTGGSGKTGLACEIVANVSKGSETIFDRAEGVPAEWVKNGGQKVIFFSSEDDFARVLKPRLKRYGADFRNILTVTPDNPLFSEIKFNSKVLERILAKERPALVVFDPLQSFIPPDVNMSARNEMRHCLNALVGYGHKYNVTFIVIMHCNKKQGVSGQRRLADSTDIWDIARSVFLFGQVDKNGLKYVSHEKSNYGVPAKTVLFEVDKNGMVKLKGTTDKKDDDFVSDIQVRQRPASESAKELILNSLEEAENHKMKVKDLDEMASAIGISTKTFGNVKTELRKSGLINIKSEGFADKVFYISLNDSGEDGEIA